MKRISTIVMLLAAVFVSVNAQLLYKVSGGNLKKPSYIVGTFHLAQASFADSIAGMREAMAQTEQVYGELDMQQMMSAEGSQKLMQAMMLPDGKTLKDILTAEELGPIK